MVFCMFEDYKHIICVVALDAKSGKPIWERRFHIKVMSNTYQMSRIEMNYFYVMEGTATIPERQHLRAARISGIATHSANNDAIERENKRAKVEKEDVQVITRILKKTQDTTFPVLFFSCKNMSTRKGSQSIWPLPVQYFEGAAIAETGELLYFKNNHT